MRHSPPSMGNRTSCRSNKPRTNPTTATPMATPSVPWMVHGRDLENLLHESLSLEQRWRTFVTEDITCPLQLEPHCPSADRYTSRFVYSHSKVKLSGGRYINANYVLQKKYIASQAPLSETMAPFWEMVVSQRVTVIVMLTRLVEGSYTKALRYWPTTNHPIKMFDDKEYDVGEWTPRVALPSSF